MAMPIFLDNFSGDAVDIKRGDRTVENLVSVLEKSPMISTWDFQDNLWLWKLAQTAIDKGLIKELKQPYPWHKYEVIKPNKQ